MVAASWCGRLFEDVCGGIIFCFCIDWCMCSCSVIFCVSVVCCRSGVSSVYSGVCCSGGHGG